MIANITADGERTRRDNNSQIFSLPFPDLFFTYHCISAPTMILAVMEIYFSIASVTSFWLFLSFWFIWEDGLAGCSQENVFIHTLLRSYPGSWLFPLCHWGPGARSLNSFDVALMMLSLTCSQRLGYKMLSFRYLSQVLAAFVVYIWGPADWDLLFR